MRKGKTRTAQLPKHLTSDEFFQHCEDKKKKKEDEEREKAMKKQIREENSRKRQKEKEERVLIRKRKQEEKQRMQEEKQRIIKEKEGLEKQITMARTPISIQPPPHLQVKAHLQMQGHRNQLPRDKRSSIKISTVCVALTTLQTQRKTGLSATIVAGGMRKPVLG